MATTTKPTTQSTTKPARKVSQTTSATKKLSDSIASPKFWHKSAPQAMAYKEGMADKDSWTLWSQHLGKRHTPLPLEIMGEATTTPLKWGLTLTELSPRTVELLALLDQLSVQARQDKPHVSEQTVEQILAGWLEGSHALPQSIDFALECLVVAHLLPRVAEVVLPEFWWGLADALWQIADSASDWRSDAELPAEQGLAQQLLAGELPLTLAALLPEMRPVRKLLARAREALTEGLAELTNGNGLVQGKYLGYQRPMLACWTRCQLLGGQLKKDCWSRKSNKIFQWMVTHSLALSSPLGTPLLGGPHDEAWSPEFLRCVLKMGGDEAQAAAAKSIFSKPLTTGIKAHKESALPENSDNCEWAGVAYLRTDWQRKAPVLAVDYSSPDLRLECWVGPQRLLAGVWSWKTTLHGKPLEPVGSWEESCWFSDEDVDYLELSIDLKGGARLERQILLARDEMFLLLADYIIDTNGGQLCHRASLPLDQAVAFEPEQETREGLLTANKTLARVLPLALPEWRSDPRVGQLTTNNDHLQLEQQREGQNLACPLLIDLKGSRAKKACTWRQLTIAQSLEIQSHDVAVGYRAQCGKDQWLIYRSLVEPANRTLLGQNLSNECLVARFLAPEGEIDALLEIE